MFSKKCKEHFEETGMTRWEHFRFACGFLIELKKAEIALFIHIFIPRCFKTYASDKIKELAKRLEDR